MKQTCFFFKSNYYTSVINGSGGSRGGAGGAPPPLVWTKLRPDFFLRPPPTPYPRVWMTPPPPPLSEGLDPPLNGLGQNDTDKPQDRQGVVYKIKCCDC